jgi:hypothetical protein
MNRGTMLRGTGRAPWLGPYEGWARLLRGAPPPRRLDRLNRLARARGLRTESGHPLRFVDAATVGDGCAYEARIARTGDVPTRLDGPGALHDLYNALVWLRFPRTKARLNALQAVRIALDGVGGRRGAVRDAVTHFDENALLWVCAEPEPTRALRDFDWQRLFVAMRGRVGGSVGVWAFGHALLEKLEAPYKAITAHAWTVPVSPRAGADEVDAAVAAQLAAAPPSPAGFAPLPVMGLPGWCDDNEDPRFYEDRAVFRAASVRPRRGAGGCAAAPEIGFNGGSGT